MHKSLNKDILTGVLQDLGIMTRMIITKLVLPMQIILNVLEMLGMMHQS